MDTLVQNLPVVVVGGGPVGLAAAAHLVADGLDPLVIEAAPEVAGSVRDWGHVRLFSPWRYNIDAAAAELLWATGWSMPDPDALPTGDELVDDYLTPLAAVPELVGRIRTGTRVTAISRVATDKVRHERADTPFTVHIESAGGEEVILARAVIDASGTWTSPNPLGGNGVPALGERAGADRIRYGIPDVLGAERTRYAGRTVLVVGSGHSAANALLSLVALRAEAPATRIVWAIRGSVPRAYGGGETDELRARGELGSATGRAVRDGVIELVTGFRAERVSLVGSRLAVTGGERTVHDIDEIIVATGQRPDLSLTRELRVDLDEALESTRVLAPLIDPNVHSCGTVRPHSYRALMQPETALFVAGVKSYGRAPTFLLATGYEQVRSISAYLSGDHARADRVNLVLPESGVCGGVAATAGSSSCC
jgi:thioredoxin reductase